MNAQKNLPNNWLWKFQARTAGPRGQKFGAYGVERAD